MLHTMHNRKLKVIMNLQMTIFVHIFGTKSINFTSIKITLYAVKYLLCMVFLFFLFVYIPSYLPPFTNVL